MVHWGKQRFPITIHPGSSAPLKTELLEHTGVPQDSQKLFASCWRGSLGHYVPARLVLPRNKKALKITLYGDANQTAFLPPPAAPGPVEPLCPYAVGPSLASLPARLLENLAARLRPPPVAILASSCVWPHAVLCTPRLPPQQSWPSIRNAHNLVYDAMGGDLCGALLPPTSESLLPVLDSLLDIREHNTMRVSPSPKVSLAWGSADVAEVLIWTFNHMSSAGGTALLRLADERVVLLTCRRTHTIREVYMRYESFNEELEVLVACSLQQMELYGFGGIELTELRRYFTHRAASVLCTLPANDPLRNSDNAAVDMQSLVTELLGKTEVWDSEYGYTNRPLLSEAVCLGKIAERLKPMLDDYWHKCSRTAGETEEHNC